MRYLKSLILGQQLTQIVQNVKCSFELVKDVCDGIKICINETKENNYSTFFHPKF
jgi:hypothetical protein